MTTNGPVPVSQLFEDGERAKAERVKEAQRQLLDVVRAERDGEPQDLFTTFEELEAALDLAGVSREEFEKAIQSAKALYAENEIFANGLTAGRAEISDYNSSMIQFETETVEIAKKRHDDLEDMKRQAYALRAKHGEDEKRVAQLKKKVPHDMRSDHPSLWTVDKIFRPDPRTAFRY